jgi:hypothetical protein
VELAVRELEALVGVEAGADLGGLAFKDGSYALAATGQLEVSLVGHHDGFWATSSSDHDRLCGGTRGSEALEHRR